VREVHDPADDRRPRGISEGKIFIGGRLVNDVPPKDRDIAMVFQALVADGFRVPVPAARTTALQPYAGRKLIFGIRPEDVVVASGTDGRPTFEAVVEVVEPLGAEILLDMRAGTDTLTARVEPHLVVRVKDRIRLALAEDKMHFFDPETEQVIR
jgi:multiple sugar transport system ATP-binding protein